VAACPQCELDSDTEDHGGNVARVSGEPVFRPKLLDVLAAGYSIDELKQVGAAWVRACLIKRLLLPSTCMRFLGQ
jgi:hypothetical protein